MDEQLYGPLVIEDTTGIETTLLNGTTQFVVMSYIDTLW